MRLDAIMCFWSFIGAFAVAKRDGPHSNFGHKNALQASSDFQMDF